MLRFAPSPTADMHIGSLRIAIFNYIISKQNREDFIIRIEDMDKEKNIEGKDQEILDILGLFGIEYSQVIYQSQNVRFHSAMALQLVHEKKAFSCFCSDNWIQKKEEEAETEKKPYYYDDACRNLPAELIIDNTNPFTVRVTRPDENLIINDKIKGDIVFKPDFVDSFVILNQDKTPTYGFATAVDDMLSDISLVIRDEKNLHETSKQDHVRNLLMYEKRVEYAHLPQILNEDSFSIKSLLELGFLPEAILNYLISLGNETPQEIFSLNEAVEWLDLDKISTSPTRFDIKTLRDINKKHLMALDPKELSRYVGFADAEIGELARVYLEEAATTKELRSKISPIFSEFKTPKELSKQVTLMRTVIKNAPYFEEYEAFKKYIIRESSLKGMEYEKTLRVLLTNSTEDGPDIAKIYKYLKNYIGEIIK